VAQEHDQDKSAKLTLLCSKVSIADYGSGVSGSVKIHQHVRAEYHEKAVEIDTKSRGQSSQHSHSQQHSVLVLLSMPKVN